MGRISGHPQEVRTCQVRSGDREEGGLRQGGAGAGRKGWPGMWGGSRAFRAVAHRLFTRLPLLRSAQSLLLLFSPLLPLSPSHTTGIKVWIRYQPAAAPDLYFPATGGSGLHAPLPAGAAPSMSLDELYAAALERSGSSSSSSSSSSVGGAGGSSTRYGAVGWWSRPAGQQPAANRVHEVFTPEFNPKVRGGVRAVCVRAWAWAWGGGCVLRAHVCSVCCGIPGVCVRCVGFGVWTTPRFWVSEDGTGCLPPISVPELEPHAAPALRYPGFHHLCWTSRTSVTTRLLNCSFLWLRLYFFHISSSLQTPTASPKPPAGG